MVADIKKIRTGSEFLSEAWSHCSVFQEPNRRHRTGTGPCEPVLCEIQTQMQNHQGLPRLYLYAMQFPKSGFADEG